jgi:hypothetical protein
VAEGRRRMGDHLDHRNVASYVSTGDLLFKFWNSRNTL